MAIKFTPWENHALYCMNFLYKEGLLQDLERDWVERRIKQRLKENPNYGKYEDKRDHYATDS